MHRPQPRQYQPLDRLLINADQVIRTLFGRPPVSGRADPAEHLPDTELSSEQADHVARLMRINHTGEVCAQGLYHGQAITARSPEVREAMEHSAIEENDHLAWCEQRVKELGGRLSYLNPAFYAGSFALGAAAGLVGDRWSLGFVAETERQVEGHLDEHLGQIPADDQRTRAILEQMKDDEMAHGQKATQLGGVELPAPIRMTMTLTSKLMTRSVYRF